MENIWPTFSLVVVVSFVSVAFPVLFWVRKFLSRDSEIDLGLIWQAGCQPELVPPLEAAADCPWLLVRCAPHCEILVSHCGFAVPTGATAALAQGWRCDVGWADAVVAGSAGRLCCPAVVAGCSFYNSPKEWLAEKISKKREERPMCSLISSRFCNWRWPAYRSC